ncbi:MAG: 50S ribosomal protein L22 [Candidatus Peregrinibacteria bacterium Gr01-1014_25]|nr:MAG: 50S ribosomal protein L22 [Candidatus Peregrinibacteria bacterium Gr01-1014_25]
MKASLHSVRIAPKKANVVARMVRGMPVLDAIALLERTHKKAARLVEDLLRSAVANAVHNEKQDPAQLTIRTIIVNQATGLSRGVPMARGRMRPMKKFMSHIDVVLGVMQDEEASGQVKNAKKTTKAASQGPKKTVQKRKSKDSPGSSVSSHSPVSPS